MAVIQDLPPELLIHILELMANAQLNVDQRAETRRSFARASLVAQNWRAPSQRLLASTLWVYTGTPLWNTYLKAAPDRSNFHSTMQYLEVCGSQGSADELALLQQRGIAVQELAIYADGLHFNPAHIRLLQGVRRLTLWNSVKLDDGLGSGATLMLEALYVYFHLAALPAWILPLSTVAPRLTRLTLEIWHYDRFKAFEAPLQDLAPQLRHLHLQPYPSWSLQKDAGARSVALDRFLSVCTSLTSFQVDHVNPLDLKYILSSFPSPLILLKVYLILRSVEEESELMMVQLAGVFDLPCMTKLKRWRMSGRVYDGPGRPREISNSAMEEWRAACQERGIEPRGEERYFTD